MRRVVCDACAKDVSGFGGGELEILERPQHRTGSLGEARYDFCSPTCRNAILARLATGSLP